MPQIALFLCFLVSGWLIYQDTKARLDVSRAIWVPTLWVLILASRPLSTWFAFDGGNFGDSSYSLEGSPIDRLGFLGLIVAAWFINHRRGVRWSSFFAKNQMLLVFYAFFFLSIFWASSPFASFKRLFKDFGCVIVAMVILTETNPVSALKAVFIRSGCLLIPLSEVFLRYFPHLGRVYSPHSGEMQVTGVTFQKNSLGAMVLVCGLFLFWNLLEEWGKKRDKTSKVVTALHMMILMAGAHLLHSSDSKTATVCFFIGIAILLSSRLRVLRRHMPQMVKFGLVGGVTFFVLDKLFHIKDAIIISLGRDPTLTGRTDVWQALLDLKTNPILGTGFCDFWSNAAYRSRLPEWVAFSAHNGYLETYLDGGIIGVGILLLLLVSVAFNVNRALKTGSDLALLRFAVLAITIVYAFSESIFGRIGPNWFLFILASIDYRSAAAHVTKSQAASRGAAEAAPNGFPRHQWASSPSWQ